jgi:hypothetical protein
MPIGVPLPGVSAKVVDRAGRMVPDGVPGELLVGGPFVARGYRNRPELTAERFISAADSEDRWYRSGDLVRRLRSGEIEFLSRIDQQAKLHGFRIEPAEIESAVMDASKAAEAVAVLREDLVGGPGFVVYYSSRNGSVNEADLAARLRESLPSYMIPRQFTRLDALPKTASGKIDRRALPAPAASTNDGAAVAPRDEMEESILRILEDVLQRNGVGVHEDFFSLGGHSLHAMRLAARLSEALEKSVAVKDVFLAPSVAQLARRLSTPAETMEAATIDPTKSVELAMVDEPIEELIAKNALPRIDAAALTAIPAAILPNLGLNKAMIIGGLLQDKPMAAAVFGTPHGRIAMIALPRFDVEVYDDREALVQEISEAVEMAAAMGARGVSLTGLLPSATDFGRAIPRLTHWPELTTGHATTAAAVVANIVGILSRAGRLMRNERVAFVGLGSIGTATLRLAVNALEPPRSIILCDLPSQLERLVSLRNELTGPLGYKGEVHIVTTRGSAPDAVYDATLIVGATNHSEAIDVDRIRPGTLVVDDSAPHCFPIEKALRRAMERRDVLFAEAGLLSSKTALERAAYVPPLASGVGDKLAKTLASRDSRVLMGCTLSSLLCASPTDLSATIGEVRIEESVKHLARIRELGFNAAPPQIADVVFDDAVVEEFRARFGESNRLEDGGFPIAEDRPAAKANHPAKSSRKSGSSPTAAVTSDQSRK